MSKISIFANTLKPVMKSVLPAFFEKIRPLKHTFCVSDRLTDTLGDIPAHIVQMPIEEMLEESDLVLSFGGDGTMLMTARMIGDRSIPILGINLGGLGFLTASSIEESIGHIAKFFNGELVVEPRLLLKLDIDRLDDPVYLLNDFVADKAGFSRMIQITVDVDDRLLNSYLADGLIIATPTGSTAYSLANGGPIVNPTTNAFVINPICPHTLSNRPIIISDSAEIRIAVKSELGAFNVFGDGHMIGKFPLDTKVVLSKADFMVNLVQTPSHEFYTILREKLGWGENFRKLNR
jgi:NAD+ kinase